jgi:hypothetical protein
LINAGGGPSEDLGGGDGGDPMLFRFLIVMQTMLFASPVALAKGGGKNQERHIVRESKSKDKKQVNFETVEIDGKTKTPLEGLVSSPGGEKGYQFVKIRTRWHPEMIGSTGNLGKAAKR